MTTKFKPNYAIHPGEFLRDEMLEMGISQKGLAESIGVSKTIINEVLNGKRKINADLAVKLETALYSSATVWLNLQAIYDEAIARMKHGIEKNEIPIVPIFPGQFSISYSCEYPVVKKLKSRSAA